MPDYPFLHPTTVTPYNPGKMSAGSGDMGQLMAMFAGPLLGQLAGPGNFVPQLSPTQNMMDQYAMRTYQNSARANTFNMSAAGDDAVATRLLGARAAVTNAPVTQLNREQAQSMAGMLNNPFTKAILGAAVGPERLEAMMFGSKGDVGAMAQNINKIGYFRSDPMGGGRMSAQGLSDYTKNIHDELYQPTGELEELAKETRAGERTSREKLKKAARAEHKTLISDEDAADSLLDMPEADTKVAALYKKYVSGGKATDIKTQAKELSQFDNALAAAGVLDDDKITVNGLKQRAEKMAIGDMHGFMAGQIGQLTEHMYQTGELPQALGSMSAADRVKAISGIKPDDDETITRLAKDYGHRELMKTDAEYRGKTAEGQKEQLNSGLDSFKDKLKTTLTEVDRTQKGASGAKSIDQLEELGGMDLLAGHVDAKRTAASVKEMTGAVAAVREIFGDNGNSDAPMPALLAALEQLSQGSSGQVGRGKIEIALRQMQTLAKESGVGFEQLTSLSANMGAMGDMLGVAKGTTMQSTANVLAQTKAMRDTGAFSKPVYGALTQEEAMKRGAELESRGNASSNALGMATLKGLYEASLVDDGTGTGKKTSKFAGSEMEAAVKAYSDPKSDGTYKYTDKATNKVITKNLHEVVGRGGAQVTAAMYTQAGGAQSEYSTRYFDPRTKGEVMAGFGKNTQTYEARRDVNNFSTSTRVSRALRQYGKDNAGSEFAGLSDRARHQLSLDTGSALTDMVFDSAMMQPGEQIDHIQNTVEQKMTDVFAQRGHANPAAAAKEFVTATFGKTEGERRQNIDQYIAGGNSVYGFRTGGLTIAEDAQRTNAKKEEHAEKVSSAERSQRRAQFGTYETGPVQQAADFLFGLGERGENFTPEGLIKSLGKSVSDKDLMNLYSPEMGGAFEALTRARREMSVTHADVDKLAVTGVDEPTRKANEKELRKLAGVGDDVKVYSDTELKTERDKKIAGLSEVDLRAAYKSHLGKDLPDGALDNKKLEAVRGELGDISKFNDEIDKGIVGDKGMTAPQLIKKARGSVGRAKDPARADDLEHVTTVMQSLLRGDNPDQVKRGVRLAAGHYVEGGIDEKKIQNLQDIASRAGSDSPENLEKEIDALGLTFGSAQQKKDFIAVMRGAQKAKEVQAGKSGFEIPTDKALDPQSHVDPKQAGAEHVSNATGADTAALDARVKEQKGILHGKDKDEREILERESEYARIAADIKEAEAAGDTENVDKLRDAQKVTRDGLIAVKTAKRQGLPFTGHIMAGTWTRDDNGAISSGYAFKGKQLDPKISEEEEAKFLAAEQTGTPISEEGQKLYAAEKAIAAEREGVAAKGEYKKLLELDKPLQALDEKKPPQKSWLAGAAEMVLDAVLPKNKKQQFGPQAGSDAVEKALDAVLPAETKQDPKQTGHRVAANNATAAAQQVGVTSRNITPANGGPSGGREKLTIGGTLSLVGLTEAIISAGGTTPIPTEGGAPIVQDTRSLPAIPQNTGQA